VQDARVGATRDDGPVAQRRVAIVTGASRELGAAMAVALAETGRAVVVAHHGEPALADDVVARIRSNGAEALAFDADLSTVSANEDLVAFAVRELGRVDVFVANAGVTRWAPFLEVDEALWDTVVDLNLKGSYFGAQAAARRMVEQGDGGRIVFSSSVTGLVAVPAASAYSVTKAGLAHMARVLALELAPHGITANALAIGATVNERNLRDDPDYATRWADVIPTGRVGQPQDVAAALLYLASEDAAMVTGHTLRVDGGWAAVGDVPAVTRQWPAGASPGA
jgi:NAD(P)-dependent dehydrogenase (short-subunit alcohol dehydrogenase family)